MSIGWYHNLYSMCIHIISSWWYPFDLTICISYQVPTSSWWFEQKHNLHILTHIQLNQYLIPCIHMGNIYNCFKMYIHYQLYTWEIAYVYLDPICIHGTMHYHYQLYYRYHFNQYVIPCIIFPSFSIWKRAICTAIHRNVTVSPCLSSEVNALLRTSPTSLGSWTLGTCGHENSIFRYGLSHTHIYIDIDR